MLAAFGGFNRIFKFLVNNKVRQPQGLGHFHLMDIFSVNGQLERDLATREGEMYLRANRRHKTSSVVLITNLNQPSIRVTGILLDFSTSGMRIETPFSFHLGDSVRVETESHMVLGEVVHSMNGSVGVEVGIKLIHSLDRENLATFLKPLWAELF